MRVLNYSSLQESTLNSVRCDTAGGNSSDETSSASDVGDHEAPDWYAISLYKTIFAVLISCFHLTHLHHCPSIEREGALTSHFKIVLCGQGLESSVHSAVGVLDAHPRDAGRQGRACGGHRCRG